jgi:hypothetical protein
VRNKQHEDFKNQFELSDWVADQLGNCRKVSALPLRAFYGIQGCSLATGYGVMGGDSLIAVNPSVLVVLQRKTVPRWAGSPGHMTYRAE